MRQLVRRLRVILLCALTFVCGSRPHTTLPSGGGPTTIAAGQPGRVRLVDGSFTLANAQVIGHSLAGRADAPFRRCTVEQHQLSNGRTAAAMAAGIVVLVVGAGLLAIAALVSSL
jgi:subtilisin family serine protease